MGRIASRYHNQFTRPPEGGAEIAAAGRKYLAEHGIDDKSIVESYRLGIVVEPLAADEPHQGRLCIPYLSPLGGVKAIKYRALGDGPKMMQYQNQQARLYNTLALLDAADVIGVAEGEADAIAATERLGIPTVGIPGVETWTAHADIWRLAFRDFRLVFMLADGDQADKTTGRRPGRDLGKAVSASVSSADTEVRIIECPEGEDVSSMVAAGKQDWFADKLRTEIEDDD